MKSLGMKKFIKIETE